MHNEVKTDLSKKSRKTKRTSPKTERTKPTESDSFLKKFLFFFKSSIVNQKNIISHRFPRNKHPSV